MEPNTETITVLTKKYNLSQEQVSAILQEHCGKVYNCLGWRDHTDSGQHSQHYDSPPWYQHNEYPSGVN